MFWRGLQTSAAQVAGAIEKTASTTLWSDTRKLRLLMNPKPVERETCTKQNDCKAASHFGDCASMPSPTMPVKQEVPECLTVNVCIRCGVLNVGLNDCRSCAMPPNLSETSEYVRHDRHAKVVEALRGMVLKPNCWCPIGYWFTQPEGTHSLRCMNIQALLTPNHGRETE